MINVVPRTFNNFPGGRYMFLDKFDIFVFRYRASRRAQRWCKIDAHDRESRCRIDEHSCRRRVYFPYVPLWRCVRRPSRRSSVLPLSLYPVSFLSHIHDVIATPSTVTRSHFDPRRSISVFRPLFLCFPRSLSSLLLFPFIPLAYTFALSVAERIANLAGVDTPLSLFTRSCHLDRPCAVQPRIHGLAHTYAKIVRKQEEEKKGKKNLFVCVRARARACEKVRRGIRKRNERCSNNEEEK